MAVPSVNNVPTDLTMAGTGASAQTAESTGENFDRVFAAAKPPVKEGQGEAQPQEAPVVPPLFRVPPQTPDMDVEPDLEVEVPINDGDLEEQPELPKPGLFDPDMILALEFTAAHQRIAEIPKQAPPALQPDGELNLVSASMVDTELIADVTAEIGSASDSSDAALLFGEKDLMGEEQLPPVPKDLPSADFPEALLEEETVFKEERASVGQRQLSPENRDTTLPLTDEVLASQNFRRSLAEKRSNSKTGVNVTEDRPTIDKGVSQPLESLSVQSDNITQGDRTVQREDAPEVGSPSRSELTEGKASFAKDAFESVRKESSAPRETRDILPALERPTRTFSVMDILASLRTAVQEPTPENVRTGAVSPPPSTAVTDFFGDNTLGRGVQAVLEFLKNEGVTQARMVVDPPALGRIDVSLQATANGIEAIFRVDNEQLRQLLQNQLDQLKQSLLTQGIHVSGLSVDIRSGDERDRPETAVAKKLKRSGGVEGADDEVTDDSTMIRLDLEKGLLHWVG